MFTPDEWVARLADTNGLCARCGDPERDVYPVFVNDPIVYGTGIDNVTPGCKRCRLMAHRKDEWRRKVQ